MNSIIERVMFPHTFDSTILATFRSCPQKFLQQYVNHWKPNEQSVHLIAGGAFAAGIEAARKHFYCEGKSSAESEAHGLVALIRHYGDFEPPADSPKSLERMCGALEYYFDKYQLGADGAEPITLPNGRKGIEFSFAEPLDIRHPVSGDPILYTGRSDMIAHRAGGIYCYDEKTTSSLGAQWTRQWEMRSQFTGYGWATRKQGINLQGFIIRGVSILKTKYDTLEVPTYRSDYEIDRWEIQTIRDIKRAITMWEEGYWDYSLDSGCVEYGSCPFVRVCKSHDPETWLPMYFRQAVWDPLARRELTVAEHEAAWGHVRSVPIVEPAAAWEATPEATAVLNNELSEMLTTTGVKK